MDELEDILEKLPEPDIDNLIPILQQVQDNYGYLNEEAIKKIAKKVNLPVSRVFGLASFYNQFRFSPRGKYHIRLCSGTNCHMNKAGHLYDQIRKTLNIQDGETSRDGVFSLEMQSCMGACGRGPVLEVNGEYYEQVTRESLKELIEFYRHLEEKKYV